MTAHPAEGGRVPLRAGRRPGRLRPGEQAAGLRPHPGLGQGRADAGLGVPRRRQAGLSRAGARADADAHPTVVSRYRGKVASWDVVNEALDDGEPYLRPSSWLTHRRPRVHRQGIRVGPRGRPRRPARLQRLQRRAAPEAREAAPADPRASGARTSRWTPSASRATGRSTTSRSATSKPCSPR